MPESPKRNDLPENYRPLDGSERPRPATHQFIGPADAAKVIGVTLVIRPRPGSQPLPDLDHWQATPPGQRRFLSPAEYTQAYGAAQADLDAVAVFAAAHGLTVLDSHIGRRSVTLKGTVTQLNEAFGITLNHYQGPRPAAAPHTRAGAAAAPVEAGTQTYHGYEDAVHLPSELIGVVLAVIGLDNRSLGDAGGSSGDPPSSQQLAVPTIAQYYNFPNTGAADQTIGVIAPSDPPGVTNRRLSGYLSNDILHLYFPNLTDSSYRTAPTLHDIGLTVGTNAYTNNTGSVTSSNNFALEVTQDISTSSTIAQGATVNVYFTELTEQGLIVCLNRILLPEGEIQPTVVTCSFNFYGSDSSIGSVSSPGSPAAVMSTLFQQLAALGINVFIISQDKGSNDGITDGSTHVNYPGSDPWVTCVGGTVVGNVQNGPPLKFEEWVWSNVSSSSAVGGFAGASGGGASATFPVPGYQTAADITQITDSNGNTSSNRFIPDIAGMVAYGGSNNSSPNDWFYINGSKSNFVGTSCATPLFAGLIAVLRSAFGVELGFLNPTLYQLGNSVCNDVTHGNNDPADGSNAPYYTAGPGWDACAGWGSIDGTKLLNSIASLMYTQTFYFQAEKTTYGLDEVRVNEVPLSTGDSTYAGTFWLVLEGFTPDAATGFTITANMPALPGVTISVGAGKGELGSLTSTPQRILYLCSLTFANDIINPVAQDGIFPAPGGAPIELTLTATARSLTQLFTATIEFQLVGGADPNFANFTSVSPQNPQEENVFYLSQDLRVFTVTPGAHILPSVPGVSWPGTNYTDFDTASAYTYIQNLINTLTSSSVYNSPGGTDPFTLLTDQSNALTGDSSVTPTTINPGSVTSSNPTGTTWTNYNFAIARVRLTGAPGPTNSNVRVFFRLFATETNDTDYQPESTYAFTSDASGLPGAPVIGMVGTDVVTIPFFATGNYDSSSSADYGVNDDYPLTGESVNSKLITVPTGGTAWAYFGCYLNIYPTTNTIKVNGQTPAVQSLLPSTHCCVVAQIAFDDAPIPTGGTAASPANSDKLAQRNLQITLSDNPGPPATHRIPQTFDVRPSPAITDTSGNLLNYPDELMIDWGNTPVGSTAYIYWPQVNAEEVLALAKQIYSTHQLSSADANTIQCKVPQGFTFVPIPTGSGQNFAGLLTVDLPSGVLTGQVFNIVVRRIATRRPDNTPPPPPPIQIDALPEAMVPVREKVMRNWRYVVGTFAVRIPVTTPKVMLPLEENTLAIMKWRLSEMSPANRWYPVLQRYIGYVIARINGLGGNAGTIEPSPIGVRLPLPKVERRHQHTGKVSSLIYDRFGDFGGFCLLTEAGEEREFLSRESEIEALVRFAWQDRVVITVVTAAHDPICPVSIILRRAPRPRRRFP
jgi:hypothetical protein